MIGDPIAGVWKLQVTDTNVQDAGSITAFGLDITPSTFNCQSPAPPPDLTLSKSHTGNFTVGQNGVYTLTVNNAGTSPTTGTITVTDTLPTGLSFVSGTGAGWSCGAAAQVVTCTNPGPLAVGASSSAITLTVGVAASAAPQVALDAARSVTASFQAVSACTPRPSVVSNATAGGGALNIHIESTPMNTAATNPLQQVVFGTFQNATVTMSGQQIASGQTVMAPANTTSADFTVRRITPGQPTTVPFTVVDGCGEWKTFVGGGAGAGF